MIMVDMMVILVLYSSWELFGDKFSDICRPVEELPLIKPSIRKLARQGIEPAAH